MQYIRIITIAAVAVVFLAFSVWGGGLSGSKSRARIATTSEGVQTPQRATGHDIEMLEGQANGTNKVTIRASNNLTQDMDVEYGNGQIKVDGVAWGNYTGSTLPSQGNANGKYLKSVSGNAAWSGFDNISTSGTTKISNAQLSGTPTAPTAAPGTNTTQLANTAFVQAAVSGITAGYVATPPTYSDQACTPGQYSVTEAYRFDCIATGNWNRTALTDWSNPTPAIVSISPTSKTFADTSVGSSSSSQSFVVQNIGLGTLTLTPGLSITGTNADQFALSKGTCTDGTTLAADASCTASIVFNPTTTGAKIANLLVDSDTAVDVTAGLGGSGTAAALTDNFNRANGSLGANWTTVKGDPRINSNVVVATTATDGIAYWSANSFSTNQFAQAVFSGNNDGYRGVCVRVGDTIDAYCVRSVNASTLSLIRVNAGVNNQVASFTGLSAYVGKTVKLEATGSNPVALRVYIDGVQQGSTYNDSNASRVLTGKPGLYTYETYGALLDDWQGGDL